MFVAVVGRVFLLCGGCFLGTGMVIVCLWLWQGGWQFHSMAASSYTPTFLPGGWAVCFFGVRGVWGVLVMEWGVGVLLAVVGGWAAGVFGVGRVLPVLY